MAPVTRIQYYRVVGSRRVGDKVRLFLEEVADFRGTAMPAATGSERVHDVAPANRQPDDTIVKITETTNLTFEVNPTA